MSEPRIPKQLCEILKNAAGTASMENVLQTISDHTKREQRCYFRTVLMVLQKEAGVSTLPSFP